MARRQIDGSSPTPASKANLPAPGASVAVNRYFDVEKFEKALQERHQSMQVPTNTSNEINYEDKGRYLGTVVNGKRQGFGEYFFPNGDYYKGLWVADTMSGLGYYRYAVSRRAYFGEFSNGKNQGKGSLATDEKQPTIIYDGDWNNGLKHGNGIYIYSYDPLEYYDGAWQQGLKSGKGMYFRQGNIYRGLWSNNKRNGKGQYTTREGAKYSGDWKNDQLDQGKVVYPKGGSYDIYQGELSKGLRNGRGVYIYAEGGRYEGAYKDDLRHGNGKEVAGSAIYEGDFSQDKKHGQGMYTYKNGDKYEGPFFEGKKHGPNSVYTWVDGTTFRGLFQNDSMYDGIFTDANDGVARTVSRGNII